LTFFFCFVRGFRQLDRFALVSFTERRPATEAAFPWSKKKISERKMLSNLASYIFGAGVETGAADADPAVASVPEAASEAEGVTEAEKMEDEEWELVGEDSPALTLGSLGDMMMARPILDSSVESESVGEGRVPDESREVSRDRFY
jgi:hypothetical protein